MSNNCNTMQFPHQKVHESIVTLSVTQLYSLKAAVSIIDRFLFNQCSWIILRPHWIILLLLWIIPLKMTSSLCLFILESHSSALFSTVGSARGWYHFESKLHCKAPMHCTLSCLTLYSVWDYLLHPNTM